MTDKIQTPDALVKPGYTTTEFWVTLLTVVSSAVGVLDPNVHLSGYVQGISAVVAGIASVVYMATRLGVKREAIYLTRDVAQHLANK